MVFSELLRKRMFFLVLLLYLIFFFYDPGETYGINRTINWQYDFTNWFPVLTVFDSFVFLVGYGLLMLLKGETNKYLSGLHFLLILLIGVLGYTEYTFHLKTISLLLFFCILIYAIGNQKGSKPKK